VNRRGELERAVSRARIGPAHYALFTQLLRRSGNDTGEIPDDRYAPRLETLADQAKIARSAAYPALAELIRHGWFTRYATTTRAKVAGKLTVGSDCDCGGAVPVCQREGCGKPLASRRRDARYCSDRCGKAARRLRSPVSIARTTQPAASPKSPDMSAVKPGHSRDIARPTSPKSPDNSQVSGVGIVGAHKESSKEGAGRTNGLALCALCQTPMDPVLPAAGFTTHPCCDPDEVSPLWPQPQKVSHG
jgi:hypothetical protein